MVVTKNKNDDMLRPHEQRNLLLGIASVITSSLRGLSWGVRTIFKAIISVMRVGFKAVAWSTRVLRGIIRWLGGALRGILRLPGRLLTFLWLGHIPEFETKQQAEAFWRIRRHYRRRRVFYAHALIFVTSLIFLTWNFWETRNTQLFQTPFQSYLLVGIVWSLLLWGHRFWLKMAEAEDADVAQVLEAGYLHSAELEKRKRERTDLILRGLSDDDLEHLRQRLSDDASGSPYLAENEFVQRRT